jgi:hypothetical protein
MTEFIEIDVVKICTALASNVEWFVPSAIIARWRTKRPTEMPSSDMDTTIAPPESLTLGNIAEIKQVSIASDDEISAINDLLANDWKLLHIGHLSQCTVYVLGRMPEKSRRRTGFLA